MPGGILALDLGRLSACAYIEPGRRPVWGHVVLAEPQAIGGCVLAEARKWIGDLLLRLQPSWIAQEAPYVPRPGRKVPFNPLVNARLQRLAGVPQSMAFEHGLAYHEADIRKVARHFLGTHGAVMEREKKKQQTVHICKLHGWAPVTEDEGDALALASYMEWVLSPGQARLRGEGPLFLAQS
jgi:hypothetical protein